jgi:hypothetical protein
VNFAIAWEVNAPTFEADLSNDRRTPENDASRDKECNQVIELVWHLENVVEVKPKTVSGRVYYISASSEQLNPDASLNFFKPKQAQE